MAKSDATLKSNKACLICDLECFKNEHFLSIDPDTLPKKTADIGRECLQAQT